MANTAAKNPAAKITRHIFFQPSSLTNRAKNIEKIKKNIKFNIPPALAGLAKTLKLGSWENIVANIAIEKKARRIKKER